MLKKSTSYFKKIVFLGAIVIFMSAVSTPEKTGKKIFKFIKAEKIHKIEKYYLDKEEFIDFVNGMDPKPTQEQLSKIVDYYDHDKKAHLSTFEKLEVDNIGKLKIDRIEYDYQIAKPGKDEQVNWPDSKKFEFVETPTEQIKANLTLYLSGNGKEYLMKLELMNYNGKWRMLHMFTPCSLKEIR